MPQIKKKSSPLGIITKSTAKAICAAFFPLAVIKQTIPSSCIPWDKAINDGTLSWQCKTRSVRPHLDSYGWGLCASEWRYHIAMVQQSTNTLIQVLGNTAYEKTHPQLPKILLKHLAVGSNRKEAAEKREADGWELVASLLGESRVEMTRTGIRWGEETLPMCFGHENRLPVGVRRWAGVREWKKYIIISLGGKTVLLKNPHAWN